VCHALSCTEIVMVCEDWFVQVCGKACAHLTCDGGMNSSGA